MGYVRSKYSWMAHSHPESSAAVSESSCGSETPVEHAITSDIMHVVISPRSINQAAIAPSVTVSHAAPIAVGVGLAMNVPPVANVFSIVTVVPGGCAQSNIVGVLMTQWNRLRRGACP